MEKKAWKTLAIVFIILFILETTFFAVVLYMGSKVINNEIECSNEICVGANASSYLYHDENRLCECYNQSGEIIKQEYLR